MSFSVEDSIFIAADHKIAGPVAYESYPGQILPADVSKIIWYDSTFGGSDTTGDGSYATPYATREKCLELVTLLRFYILDRSMGGRFETDPDERVYWNPAAADDSGDGLTEANAKKTYAAAKSAAVGAGRATIHALGSFTMTDLLDFRTQGEIGETLTYNVATSIPIVGTYETPASDGFIVTGITRSTVTGTLIACGYYSSTGYLEIMRSTDNGSSWSVISNPWSSANTGAASITTNNGDFVLLSGLQIRSLKSTDDGLTWSAGTGIGGIRTAGRIVWCGANYVAAANNSSTGFVDIYTSTDGATWTSRTSAWSSASELKSLATDGTQNVIISGSSGNFFQISTNQGANWTDKTSDFSGIGQYIKYNADAGYYAAFGISTPFREYRSSDLATWSFIRNHSYQRSQYGFAFSENRDAYYYARTNNSGDIYYEESGADLIFVTSSTLVVRDMIVYKSGSNEYLIMVGSATASPDTRSIKSYKIESSNIQADASNLVIDDAESLQIGGGAKCVAITSEPTSGGGIMGYDSELSLSKIISQDAPAMTVVGKKSKLSNSYIKGQDALSIKGYAISQDDISIQRNTIIGDTNFQNAGGTKKELIRDNIFHGDVSAVDPVKIIGGDISGGRSNVDAESDVQAINPMIKDEAIGKLQRESDGSPANSYLCSTSNYFTAADGEKADPGAWSGIYTLEAELYQYPFWMPKPLTDGAIRHGKRVTSGDLQGLLGEIDVYNNPDLQQEILTIALKTVPSDLLAHFRVLESLRDTKVLVNTNPEKWKTQNSFTLSAAASAGDIVLNIDPAVVYHGQWFQWAGRKYYIRIVLDDESAATRVVLNAKLADAIPDGTAIPLSYLEGQGVYNVKVRDSDMTRRFAYDPTLKTGYVLEFTRPWNQ